MAAEGHRGEGGELTARPGADETRTRPDGGGGTAGGVGAPFARLVGVSKSFGSTRALSDVDVTFARGRVHAIAGENGAGKSTLIKILMGVLQPDHGRIEVDGSPTAIASPAAARALGFAAVFQEPLVYPHLGVLENIFVAGPERSRLGDLDRPAMRRRAAALFEQLEVDTALLDRRMGELRLGHQQLVLIAKALIEDAKLIIFDEPTSILSGAETAQLFRVIQRLRSGGSAIVYISHRFEELEAIADSVTVLTDGRVAGAFEARPFDLDAIVRLMSGRETRGYGAAPAAHRAGTTGPPLLEVEGLTLRPYFEDVSWRVSRGEVLCFYGQVGAGRTEMAKALFGDLRPTAGTVRMEGKPLAARSPRQAIRAGVGYLPEDRKAEGIFATQAISENIVATVLGRIVARLARYVRRSEVRNLTDSQREALQIKMAGPSAPISSLSGGGQQKVILGRWMVERLKLLVLDEPTRGIDVMTKAQFHEIIRQLAEEGLAVVVISSDLPEVFEVADRILVMRRGRIVAEFANDGTAPPEEVLRQAVALDQADAGARGASANGNGTIVDVGGVSVLVPSGDPEEKEVTGQ